MRIRECNPWLKPPDPDGVENLKVVFLGVNIATGNIVVWYLSIGSSVLSRVVTMCFEFLSYDMSHMTKLN